MRTAAALLRSEGKSFNCPRDQFYAEIQSVIAGLAQDKRAELKAMVDWVEQYDACEYQPLMRTHGTMIGRGRV